MQEVEEERGLLDRVGALDDDRAVDVVAGERVLDRAPDREQRVELEVARRGQAEVDRLDVRDRVQPGTPARSSAPPSTGTLPPATGRGAC
jgi:hypothetical protein